MKLFKFLSLGLVLLTTSANALYIPSVYPHYTLGAGKKVQKEDKTLIYPKTLTCVLHFFTNNTDFKKELNNRIAQCKKGNRSVPLGDVIDYSIVDSANDYTKIYLTLEIKE